MSWIKKATTYKDILVLQDDTSGTWRVADKEHIFKGEFPDYIAAMRWIDDNESNIKGHKQEDA